MKYKEFEAATFLKKIALKKWKIAQAPTLEEDLLNQRRDCAELLLLLIIYSTLNAHHALQLYSLLVKPVR